MQLTTTELIDQTKKLLTAVRGSLIRVAQNLYRIKEEKAYGEKFGAFCESELGISEGFASKLLSVHKTYILEGGLPPERLEGLDYEKAYLASKLEGTVEERLAKAETLTRAELREENVDDGHVHSGELVQIHKCCGMRAESKHYGEERLLKTGQGGIDSTC